MTIDIARAIATPGWMYEPELKWLAEQAQLHHHIVELGCMVGRSTRALADHTPGFVSVFDWFQGPPDSTGEVIWTFQKPKDQYAEFKANLQDHIDSGKVKITVGDHRILSINDMTREGSPDMIFVDGDHAYKAVHEDIRRWHAILAPGGLFCGHDITIPEVERAVQELLPGYTVAPDTTIWYRIKQ